jgi:hypothetical protein
MIRTLFRVLAVLAGLAMVLGGGVCTLVGVPTGLMAFFSQGAAGLSILFATAIGFGILLVGIYALKFGMGVKPSETASTDGGPNSYLGKYFLITVVTANQDNGPLQIHGLAEAHTAAGLQIGLLGKCRGKTWIVPISAIRPAEPGTYTLESSGEVVTNPDYFAHIGGKHFVHQNLRPDDVFGNS